MKKRRSGMLPRLIIMILALYAAMMLLMLQSRISDKKAQLEELETQVARQKAANSALSEAIASDFSDSEAESMAREKLGLVMPGEVVFVDISK